VRFHTYQIPLGFASISNGNGKFPPTGDNNNNSSDRTDVILDDDDGNHVGGADADKPKKVLILMSDTGGGHRASAEAIKAAFEEEFGDKYKVNVTDLWTDHTPWPFNQLPRSYSFLVKHGTLWKMTYYASAPRVVHQPHFAATSTFIARLAVSS
jgi:1,2-diacylglycerol 3-beta-galactosyltransferase